MWETFTIRDYDTGDIIAMYLTNNAKKCEQIFGKLDSKYLDNDCDEDLHPLYNDLFETECAKKGITVQAIDVDRSYEYDF